MKTKFTTKKLVTLSMVSAIYVALTLAIAPLSFGSVQFRISEVLNLLAFINPSYGIGVTIGCLISNIFTPNIPALDIVFGTLATALSVFLIGKSKNLIVASLYPTIINGLVIGWVITASIEGVLNPLAMTPALFFSMAASVAIGEFVVVTLIGVPLIKLLQTKYSGVLEQPNEI